MQSSSRGIAAASSSGVCSAVSCGQVMSKDVPSLWYLIQCICSGDSINRFSVTILFTCLCVTQEYIELFTIGVITWELKHINTIDTDVSFQKPTSAVASLGWCTYVLQGDSSINTLTINYKLHNFTLIVALCHLEIISRKNLA